MNFFKRRKQNKYGNLVFTFPDGRKVYQVKEEYFERLPAEKLRYIQENSNYIAFLGVSKSTLEAGHKMIKRTAYEASVLDGKKQNAELKKKLDDLTKLVDQIDTTRKEFDNTNEVIMVSLFDLFYFLDNENPFEWSEETLERKRHYLNEYPYFRAFFLRKLNDYMEDYKVTWQNSIQIALGQATIQEIVKDLSLTDISEHSMNSKYTSAENTD